MKEETKNGSKQQSISSDSSSNNIKAKLEEQTLYNMFRTLLTRWVEDPTQLNQALNVTQNKTKKQEMNTSGRMSNRMSTTWNKKF